MFERRFIFFPTREVSESPADQGLAFEDVYLTASDGVKLHGWFVPAEGRNTWLWFHGNGGNIGHRLQNLALLHRHLGVSVFIFDYRGYGRSGGQPSEGGTYRDAEAALAHLRSRDDVDPERIIFFGRSLGCAVAVEMATRHRPYGLVLESPFTSIADMARRSFPLLPLGPLLRTRYNSLSKIRRVSAPLLILHGDGDELVPLAMAHRLFRAAQEPKRLYVIPGAGHNDTFAVGGEDYFSTLKGFVQAIDGSAG